MTQPALNVLYEDNHLLVVSKPALLPTMGVAEAHDSLLLQAKQYIKRHYHKPGEVYLGIVSRLDAPVSGVVVMARTSKAAARLAEQFRDRAVRKIYWAVVDARPNPTSAECTDWMVKDERHRKMHVVAPSTPGAQEARLSYRTLETLAGGTLVEVTLETGRKHQIRLQLSRRGMPIRGDRKYGSRQPFPQGIALHARQVAFKHPVRDEVMDIVAPLPPSWKPLGVRGS